MFRYHASKLERSNRAYIHLLTYSQHNVFNVYAEFFILYLFNDTEKTIPSTQFREIIKRIKRSSAAT